MMLAAQDRAAQEKEGATSTSTSLGPLSFPTLSGRESGLVTETSPQLGGRLSVLSTSRASPHPRLGRGAMAFFSGLVMGPAGSTPFPTPQVGSGRSHVLSLGPYLASSSTTPRDWWNLGD